MNEPDGPLKGTLSPAAKYLRAVLQVFSFIPARQGPRISCSVPTLRQPV